LTYITCSADIFQNKESEENKASKEGRGRRRLVVGPNAVKVFDITYLRPEFGSYSCIIKLAEIPWILIIPDDSGVVF
jgi:hypothetical protein